ncbi:MAG: hypothetical protein ACYC28_03650 [Longimicrobiales bacterium]
MSLLRPALTALALVLVGTAAAEAQRVPASVWSRVDSRWESRDDRDSDSDWDSDSDRRRGSVWDRSPDRRDRDRDRARKRYPTTARDILLGRTPRGADKRQIDRIHEDWHRRNDRYKGTREWDRRHRELHRELDRMRRDGRYESRDSRGSRTGAGRASGRVN